MVEEEILGNEVHSAWLRVALRMALDLDPVQAANDAELLACILRQRAMCAHADGQSVIVDAG